MKIFKRFKKVKATKRPCPPSPGCGAVHNDDILPPPLPKPRETVEWTLESAKEDYDKMQHIHHRTTKCDKCEYCVKAFFMGTDIKLYWCKVCESIVDKDCYCKYFTHKKGDE